MSERARNDINTMCSMVRTEYMKNRFENVLTISVIVFMFCITVIGYQWKMRETEKGSQPNIDRVSSLTSFMVDDELFEGVTDEKELIDKMDLCMSSNIVNVREMTENEDLEIQANTLAFDFSRTENGVASVMSVATAKSLNEDDLEKAAESLWRSLESGFMNISANCRSYGTGTCIEKKGEEYRITVVILTR